MTVTLVHEHRRRAIGCHGSASLLDNINTFVRDSQTIKLPFLSPYWYSVQLDEIETVGAWSASKLVIPRDWFTGIYLPTQLGSVHILRLSA